MIQANGKVYARHAITTYFVQVGESYIDLVERYVKPVYQPGDILSTSEKIIALCQGRVVTEDQARPGFWAKLLSRFVRQTSAGPGMGLPVKCSLPPTPAVWAVSCISMYGRWPVQKTLMPCPVCFPKESFFIEQRLEWSSKSFALCQSRVTCLQFWQITGANSRKSDKRFCAPRIRMSW